MKRVNSRSGVPAFRRSGVPALILAILMTAVAGCATFSASDRLKIEGDLTYLETFLSIKEQASATINWRALADEITSSDSCLSTISQSTYSRVRNERDQLDKDIRDVNNRTTALQNYIRLLLNEGVRVPSVYIHRRIKIESRFHVYVSRNRQALEYAANILEASLTCTQENLSSNSDSLPSISPQRLCGGETVPMGTQKEGGGDPVDLGVGQVVLVNSPGYISRSNPVHQWDILIIDPNATSPISILYMAENKKQPYSSNPSLWVGKTCQLKGQVIEVKYNQITGCTITLDNREYDLSDVCSN